MAKYFIPNDSTILSQEPLLDIPRVETKVIFLLFR